MPISKLPGIPDFEGLLTIAGEAYEAQGRAVFRKVDPPTVQRGRFLVQKKDGNPFLDFVGCWKERGGRALFFEAKETREDNPRLGIAVEGGGVTPKQMENLELWRDAGAAAFVLWYHVGQVRMATLEILENARLDGKSLKWRDALKIPEGQGLIPYDFLTAARYLFP